MAETKRNVMFVEFDSDSILNEISEIIELARELQKKVDSFQHKTGTIKMIEAPEKTDAHKL